MSLLRCRTRDGPLTPSRSYRQCDSVIDICGGATPMSPYEFLEGVAPRSPAADVGVQTDVPDYPLPPLPAADVAVQTDFPAVDVDCGDSDLCPRLYASTPSGGRCGSPQRCAGYMQPRSYGTPTSSAVPGSATNVVSRRWLSGWHS